MIVELFFDCNELFGQVEALVTQLRLVHERTDSGRRIRCSVATKQLGEFADTLEFTEVGRLVVTCHQEVRIVDFRQRELDVYKHNLWNDDLLGHHCFKRRNKQSAILD